MKFILVILRKGGYGFILCSFQFTQKNIVVEKKGVLPRKESNDIKHIHSIDFLNLLIELQPSENSHLFYFFYSKEIYLSGGMHIKNTFNIQTKPQH